ncbi:uncharacterized protein N7496_008585 [Penicillium cataractarum]|uniref:C2H2-type domain-containing protein n=1 Tax=Penicillium cataractarum TaxID=2100454 RepID=A0A9W9RYX3_9EURO|nr:uncharacterized protein N7496_008585 [Penicillium cataractarum]KAJ5368825.1 hypothetical protein N7496_008585 [Penicillium cataractarum]
MNTLNHWAPTFDCETCSREFNSQNAANQHMNATNHWAPRIECETCNDMFQTQSAADQHMSEYGHYRNYCKPCGRRFNNENNLRAHLNSRIHRGTEISCPFCKARFVSTSGVSHHLETSSCPQAQSLNRTSIAQMVRRADPHGIITNKFIEYPDHDEGTYTATRAAYNGQAWECYICHRQLASSNGLNQHANSPVHQQSIYHCPNQGRNCTKQFVSLAGFFNHLESESCGFIRFENVQAAQRQLTDAMAGRRMIAGVF